MNPHIKIIPPTKTPFIAGNSSPNYARIPITTDINTVTAREIS